jgi:hypothetical protein
MAHKDWCGKPCGECKKPCKLDEEIPCSPNCENLNNDGTRKIKSCQESRCDAVVEEAGECPVCSGPGGLDYGESGLDDGVYSFKWTCERCGASGKEVYNLDFACHLID